MPREEGQRSSKVRSVGAVTRGFLNALGAGGGKLGGTRRQRPCSHCTRIGTLFTWRTFRDRKSQIPLERPLAPRGRAQASDEGVRGTRGLDTF